MKVKNLFKKVLLFCIFCICICSGVYAKEGIEFINIDIYINEYGDANVKELWKCEAYSGTEWYHPYYNLGNAKITDLSVSENGNEYTLLSSWDVNTTQDFKKEKCGINVISDGLEICWGMGDYGIHEYEVCYTIKNFVDQLNDSQMVYWTLIPHNRSDSIDNASIKIHSYKKFDETISLWGFGENGGVCRVYDGYIEMKSKNSLKKNEYMTVLAKFPMNFFNSSNRAYKDFEYYYNMAIDGTDLKSEEVGGFFTQIINFVKNDYMFIIIIVVFSFILISYKYIIMIAFKGIEKIFKKIHPILAFSFPLVLIFFIYTNMWSAILYIALIGIIGYIIIKEKKVIKGRIKESDVDYYRDIPCDKDITQYSIEYRDNEVFRDKDLFKAYYIAYQYEILKNETDLLGAIILKWIREKKASIIDKNIDSKRDSIQLNSGYQSWNWDNMYEGQLYQMMYEASEDGILEKKELKKWSRNKYSKLFTWFNSVMKYEQDKLIESGELLQEKVGSRVKFTATEKMLDEGKKICGLKKYLKDFTIIHEREAIEVQLFEEYLIMAQMLGIAQKVISQFKELYPNVIEESNFRYNDYIFVHSLSHRVIRSATISRTTASVLSGGGGGGFSHSGGRGRFSRWGPWWRWTQMKCDFQGPDLLGRMGPIGLTTPMGPSLYV
jgi:hypothetical protein